MCVRCSAGDYNLDNLRHGVFVRVGIVWGPSRGYVGDVSRYRA